jgi:hypothetical protein
MGTDADNRLRFRLAERATSVRIWQDHDVQVITHERPRRGNRLARNTGGNDEVLTTEAKSHAFLRREDGSVVHASLHFCDGKLVPVVDPLREPSEPQNGRKSLVLRVEMPGTHLTMTVHVQLT